MPINAGYEYINAEKAYLNAKNTEERIACLEEMLRVAPSHKGAENLRKELKIRLKKLKEKQQKAKKSGKSSKKGIKKEGHQIVLIGLANSGKSSLLAKLTNAYPKISPYPFTTKKPEIGTMNYEGIKAQIVDLPSIGSEFFDIGISNTADTLILVLEKLEDRNKITPFLSKARGQKIIALNKSDLYTSEQLRKLNARIKSKKLNAIIISTLTNNGIEDLKKKIIKSMEVIRVYTKEPKKTPSKIPIILPKNSTVKDVAESILKGLSRKIKETRITGPSSKFSNQRVGLNHKLKDKDIVELHTN